MSSLKCKLVGGSELSLGELREMAARQQQQIDSQQQVLVAKEQRLKYLKQQEARQQQAANESDRLARLRERVQQQEQKLRKLRALRGQSAECKTTITSLGSELESMKTLFGQKEKELADAVNKVEQLSRQLEQLRQGRVPPAISQPLSTTASTQEIERLKHDLALRNKLNEEQNARLATHRESLQKRKDEMARMDQRIAELQQRLQKKQPSIEQQGGGRQMRPPPGKNNRPSSAGSNVAAVEPYIQHAPKETKPTETKQNEGFGLGKQDPKYQTLPYNLKFPEAGESVEKKGDLIYQMSDPIKATGKDSGSTENKVKEQGIISTAGKSDTTPTTSPNKSKGFYTRNLSHLTPRPYGSTYGTSVLAGKSETSVVPSAAQSPSILYAPNASPLTEPPKTSTPKTPSTGPYTAISPQKEKFMMGEAPPVTTNSPSSTESTTERTQSISTTITTCGGPTTSPSATVVASSRGGHTAYQLAVSRPPAGPAYGSSSQHGPTVIPMTSSGSRLTNQTSVSPTTFSESKPSSSSADTQHGFPVSSSFSRELQPTSTVARGTPSTDSVVDKHDLVSTDGFSRTAPSESQYTEASTSFSTSDGQDEVDHVDTSPTSVSSALSVLMSNTNPSGSRPSYRYATKSVIANTYMKRLGSNAMEQYRKNMNMLYKDFMPSGESNQPDSPTATVHPVSQQLSSSSNPAQSSLADTQTSGHSNQHDRSTNYPYQSGYDHYSNGPPLYPGSYADHERFRHRPNAPRPLRRRWSITETDEHPSRRPLGIDELPDVVHVDRTLQDTDSHLQRSTPAAPSENIPLSSDANYMAKKEQRFGPPGAYRRRTNLKSHTSQRSSRRVSFDPLALLLDASLEGELELVMRTARQVPDPSAANDEGITALHNAICAGHYEIVKFLVEFGCNVNAPDSDGWTPLHCAASCNNLAMVKFLVDHGACIFATTISDHETAAEKCEEDEDGFDGCSQYLYSVQEKLGILNGGIVYAVFDYQAQNSDELSFSDGYVMTILRKGDEQEVEWWWARHNDREGYIPRNLLGLYPRVTPKWKVDADTKEPTSSGH